MGGGGGRTVVATSPTTGTLAQYPEEIRPLVRLAAERGIELQQLLPLAGFATYRPQEVPGLTPEEQYWISRLQSVPLTTAPEEAALEAMRQLTATPLGQSPLTRAGMEAWEQWVRPQLLSESAVSGTLYGGATQEALARSATEALVPLLQEEIATRTGMIEPLMGLGATWADRYRRDIQTALEAAGLPREVAAQQAEAARQEQLRLQALAEAVTTGMFGTPLFNIPTGTVSVGRQRTSMWGK